MYERKQDRRRIPRLPAVGVLGLYVFLTGFLVHCLAHHDIARGRDHPDDHRAQIIEICTWAQAAASSYEVPDVPELQSLEAFQFETLTAHVSHHHPTAQLLPIRAPPPSLH